MVFSSECSKLQVLSRFVGIQSMDIRHKASFSVSIYTHLWPQSVSQFSMSSYLGQASTLKHLFSEKKRLHLDLFFSQTFVSRTEEHGEHDRSDSNAPVVLERKRSERFSAAKMGPFLSIAHSALRLTEDGC